MNGRQPSPSGPTAPPETSPRVLLVDDHVPLIDQLCELLPEYGIEVVGIATDGADAVAAVRAAMLRHGWVDVVVLDERMPRMNGLTAARHLRDSFPDVAVICHTAYAGLLGDRLHTAGVVAEVEKGSHPSVLVKAIYGACQTARDRRAHVRP